MPKQPATGALLGLALGDALGFPTEFNDVPSILAKCGPWREMELPKRALVSVTQTSSALGAESFSGNAAQNRNFSASCINRGGSAFRT